MDKQKPEYDELKLSRAKSSAFLRGAVAAYLVYLGYSLIRDHLRGSSTLSPGISWAAGLGFCAAGLLFGLFTWKRYRAAMAEAELQHREQQPPEQP